MLIHWGLYSILGRGEWVMHAEHIPFKEYAKLAEKFKPSKFNADRWVSLAKEAGMKYLVLTTRHHDGFCLYNSKVSDFTSVKTAAQRDFIAEYVKACRKAGLKVGLYYSLGDWRFGIPKISGTPAQARAMVAQAHAQVRELMANYGKIDLLWYDGGWCYPSLPDDGKREVARFWKSEKLNALVRKLQPHILINDRSGLPEDFGTPEGHVGAEESGRACESCMTMGDSYFSGWGYIKDNFNFKTTTQLIQCLVTAASGGGNYLLNIGPKPDGGIRKQEVDRLRAIGKWMKVNGESIYGSQRLPAKQACIPWGYGTFGITTVKGNSGYLHFFRWPGETAVVTGIRNRVLSARILGSNKKINAQQTADGRLFLKGLPGKPPNRNDTVIVLKLDRRPESFNYADIPL